MKGTKLQMNHISTVKAVYFSPTGTSKRIVECIASTMAQSLSVPCQVVDFTLPEHRTAPLTFSSTDLVILGMPVYAGRVPNVMLKYVTTLQGHGALGIPIVLYGNRNYDDALVELRDIMENGSIHTIAAAAFIGEHSFSHTLAKDRPDATDMVKARQFAQEAINNIASTDREPVKVTGQVPYRPYFRPVVQDKKFADIRKVQSKVSDACTNCGICADVCPLGSISREDVRVYKGICIKCGACTKACPTHARYYDDPAYLFHKEDLENRYARRAEPELFF
jgi:ferredoxin